jgi:hypothetical protein
MALLIRKSDTAKNSALRRVQSTSALAFAYNLLVR